MVAPPPPSLTRYLWVLCACVYNMCSVHCALKSDRAQLEKTPVPDNRSVLYMYGYSYFIFRLHANKQRLKLLLFLIYTDNIRSDEFLQLPRSHHTSEIPPKHMGPFHILGILPKPLGSLEYLQTSVIPPKHCIPPTVKTVLMGCWIFKKPVT